MRKRSWAVWIAVVVAAVIAAAWLQHYAREKYEPARTRDCLALATSPEEKRICYRDAQGHKDYLPWGFELGAWPEGITAWALLATLVGIFWQAKATRDSVAAMQRQIAVAEADSHAMIQGERAWIVVSVDEFPVGVYRFWAENKGKTPARTVSFWGESRYVGRDDAYTEKPDGTTGAALLSFPPCLMPPGDKRLVWECHRSAIEDASGGGKGEQSRFARGFGTGVIYGRLRYFDVLDAKPREPHETRWLYWLIPQPGSMPFPHPTEPEHNTYT